MSDTKDFDEIVIEGIDWQSAFSNMPDKDELRKLVQNFYRSAQKEIKEFDGLVEELDINDDGTPGERLNLYRIKAHSMKNALAIIGAQPLSAKAKVLEFAARELNFDAIAENHQGFTEEYLALARTICIQMTGNEDELTSSGEKIDNKALLAQITALEQAIADFDMNTLNEIGFALEEGIFATDEIAEKINQIIVGIRDFDIEAMESICKELRNIL